MFPRQRRPRAPSSASASVEPGRTGEPDRPPALADELIKPLLRFVARALPHGIRVGIVLLLLTPFVVSDHTIYPFVVGKAVYSRMLIEIVFGLWMVLACVNPAFRPARSWLLILLAAALAWATVAAGFGVSPQRSLWSSYERMAGLVDATHWFAFLVVVASVLRNPRELRLLLALNLAASVAVALLAVASHSRIDPILYGVIAERAYPRIGTVFGNSGYLGTYALVNFTIAAGFLARSLAVPTRRDRSTRGGWALRALLALVAVLELWALSLSGSLAAVAGLFGAGAFLTAALATCAAGRKMRLAAGVVAAALAVGFVGGFVVLAKTEPTAKAAVAGNPLWQRLTASEGARSYHNREPAWRAGIVAFADRLWLGWGQENFIAAFGRHAAGPPADGEVHDRAHNQLIERAVAEGAPGLAAYLAVWAFALCIVIRAARVLPTGERAFALSVGAALAGYFLASQFTFDAAALKLQLCLLFACAVGLERACLGLQVRVGTPHGAAPRKVLAAIAVVGGTALVALGWTANQAIHTAATAMLVVQPGDDGYIEETIAAFPPLAAEPRRRLLNHVAQAWEGLEREDAAEAKELLAAADLQARAAIAAEPENWRVRRAVARMYLAVATTEPAYRPVAAQHAKKAVELAPNL